MSKAQELYEEYLKKQAPPEKKQGDPIWPVVSTDISRGNQYGPDHPAVDIVGRTGDRISSSVSGTVVAPPIVDSDYGLNVAVRAESGPYAGYVFHYSHLAASAVQVGERVGQGEYLGMVGNSGRSFGSHLDFEVYTPGGTRIDPRSIDWEGFRAIGEAPSLSKHKILATSPLVPRGAMETELTTTRTKRAAVGSKAYQGEDKYAAYEPDEDVVRVLRTPFGNLNYREEDVSPTQRLAGFITVIDTPLGPITLANPGEMLTRWVAFGIAALVFLITIFAIVGRTKTGTAVREKVMDLAVDAGNTAAMAAVA